MRFLAIGIFIPAKRSSGAPSSSIRATLLPISGLPMLLPRRVGIRFACAKSTVHRN
jgi:hypothetical protein